MSTSSSQPTSYTSVNIGDPEPPLPNWITEQLQGLHPISNHHVSIYRVPPDLRQVNEKAFTPQRVSIGPFHHGKAELQPWEENKLRYLQAFLNRTQKSLEDCIEFVKGLEGRARACYRDKIDMTSNAFVKMMLVDSCFIIKAIWRWENNYRDIDCNPELVDLVQRDMILLENQIPFFVLHDLFRLGFNNPGEDEDKFLELSFTYFCFIIPTITELEDLASVFENVKCHLGSGLEVKHFTDLLRICHLPEKLKKHTRIYGKFVRIPNAERFHETGMKFQIGTSTRNGLLDTKFNNGFLEMPKFQVNGSSECLLRNIIALETCHYPFDSYIIDFILFMGMLINTATDLNLLIQNGIIVNNMGDSAAVASLFKNLGMETALLSPYYFSSISHSMNDYYKNPWHQIPWHEWKEILKRDYCSNPWVIILLVLTLIQTICSIISLNTNKS